MEHQTHEVVTDILSPSWMELVQAVLRADYGYMFSHEEIEGIIYQEWGNRRYYDAIRRANRETMSYGKMLINIKDQGYKVLEPDNYHREGMQRVKQAGRKIKEACDIVGYAPTDRMSVEGKERHQALSDRLFGFAATFAGREVELKTLAAGKPRIKTFEGRPKPEN